MATVTVEQKQRKSVIAHFIGGLCELGEAVETGCRTVNKLTQCAEAATDKSIEWVKEERYLEIGTTQS